MKKYNILTTDGTTGIARLTYKPEHGQLVSLEVRDENGIPSQIEAYVADVLDEQDY
jgi:hypothetical protein